MAHTYSALLAWAATLLLSGAAQAQDDAEADAGKLAFNNHCRTCHVLDKGDNRLGPSLYDIIGSKAGTAPGYRFSSAMARSGVVWNEKTLDRFIADPNAVVPGNNMKPYSGIASADERAKIVAYLKAESAGE